MRVLVIHTQLWAHYKSILFQEINRELKNQNSDNELLVAQIALHEQSRSNMIDSENEVSFDYPYQVLYPRSLDSITLKERIKGVFSAFHSFRPDILNITGWYDPAQVALALYAKLRGVKVVISVESSESDKTRSILKEYTKKVILRQAEAFFCFGKSSVNYLRSLGVPEYKIAVKKAAVVDNQRILVAYSNAKQKLGNTASESHNFIYVGRLAVEKNLNTLLSAYRNFINLNKSSSWGLLIVGDGPIRGELESYVLKYNLNRVQFVGGVAWHQVPLYLANAHVLILPSISEPWGLVVNEAMVCGMPVIVSSNCGCSEDLVESGNNGFVFDPFSINSLVESMSYYSTNPNEIVAQGEFSKKLIESFNPQKAAASMVTSFKRLLTI